MHHILPAALIELDDTARWYEEYEEGLRHDLLREYRERLTFALKMPQAGAPAGTSPAGMEIRRIRLNRFRRYAILLATIDGTPTVLAFEHSSRRPGYWRNRLE